MTPFAAVMLFALPAGGKTLFVRAENQVPVAMIEARRTPEYTEVRLQTQAALVKVCWYSTGPNSPYLLAEGHRYRYLSGDNITACPTKRDYTFQEVMVLRFEPLTRDTHVFSLVEGQGGENQLAAPASTTDRYWNFLKINLN
ncbi:MAG: hypothetical protein ACLPWS_11720 [Rhodomicrobium sp.]